MGISFAAYLNLCWEIFAFLKLQEIIKDLHTRFIFIFLEQCEMLTTRNCYVLWLCTEINKIYNLLIPLNYYHLKISTVVFGVDLMSFLPI